MTQGMKLSPEQVSLILKRAGELDARGPSITVEELVAIATEAGLDPGATEPAIREVVSRIAGHRWYRDLHVVRPAAWSH